MTLAVVFAAVIVAQTSAGAAPVRPRADITPVAPSAAIAPPSSLVLALKVHLPDGLHVQSDKPRDPSLIPTTVTVAGPPGVTVDQLKFPAAEELVQAGRKSSLLVFGSDFVVEAHLTVSRRVAAGQIRIPVSLRYQACNDRVCFAPTQAKGEWTITISAAGR